MDITEDYEIVFDEPEKVGPGVLSISAEINGEKVDPSLCKVEEFRYWATFSDGHQGEVIERMVVIPKPSNVDEGPDTVAHITYTHYLEQYKRVFESDDYIPFD